MASTLALSIPDLIAPLAQSAFDVADGFGSPIALI